MTTVIVLCAGDGHRWGDHLGIPKQLAPIGGESLLERTLRLAARGDESRELFCISRDPRLRGNWITLEPTACRFTVETLLSTADKWSGRTVVLLGDVYYSEAAIRAIFANRQDVVFFGRPGPSRYTGRDHGEIFALSFTREAWKRVVAGLSLVLDAAEEGARGNLWDFYYSIVGPPLGTIERRVFRVINDITDDADTAHDYELLLRAHSLLLSPSGGWRRRGWLALLTGVERMTRLRPGRVKRLGRIPGHRSGGA